MGSQKPPAPAAAKTPDPATIATSPSEQAKKQQEVQNRRAGGFFSNFRNISSQRGNSAVGGNNQTVG